MIARPLVVLVVLASSAVADTPEPESSTPTEEPTSTRTYTPIAPPAPAKPKQPEMPVITDEQEAPPKLSLPTEADRQAWLHPGFRLGLGATYGEFHGLRGAPSGRLLGLSLRIGLRLDEDWSLIGSFQYASATRAGGIASGIRFAGTLDPTWHVTRNLALAVGFGFAGIVEGGSRTEHVSTGLGVDQIETSYTFPDASTPIASCTGAGAAGLARGEYGYVIGPRARFDVALEAFGQWTLCTDDSGRFEPDTGKPIERRQYWPHVGGTFTVGITWR